MALQALYAPETVREALRRLFYRDESGFIFLGSDDGLDDDESWEDNMDPLRFAQVLRWSVKSPLCQDGSGSRSRGSRQLRS